MTGLLLFLTPQFVTVPHCEQSEINSVMLNCSKALDKVDYQKTPFVINGHQCLLILSTVWIENVLWNGGQAELLVDAISSLAYICRQQEEKWLLVRSQTPLILDIITATLNYSNICVWQSLLWKKCKWVRNGEGSLLFSRFLKNIGLHPWFHLQWICIIYNTPCVRQNTTHHAMHD